MKIEDCIGCNALLTCSKKCIWYHEDLDCPCASCLVKMMCYNTCDSFRNYAKKYNGHDGVKYNE